MSPCVIVTVPLPVPARTTVRVKGAGTSKVAVTIVMSDMVTVQTSVPTHAAPLQPVKIEFVIGAAVSVTALPLGWLAKQLAPHESPPVCS